MKTVMIAALISIAATTGTAFAQSTPGSTNAQAAQSINSATLAQNGQWVPPEGQPIAEKTRAQVYHSLVHAEQDGQLAHLNSTLYAHH
jgi:curli biogenesis system outer membrane secretion channel CsgG